MKPSTDVWAFLIELYRRMALKSPKFFQVFQIIGIVAGLLCGLPAFLDSIGVVLPEPIKAIESKVVGVAAVVMWAMAKLPVIDNKQPETGSGKPVPSDKVLPFTTAATLPRQETGEERSRY